MKRRHPENESRNDSVKRPAHGQNLDTVDIIIGSLIQNCSIATDADDAITRLTTAADRLDTARTSLLIARANILAKNAKSTDAVADVMKAIESDPTSAEGYLTIGQIYADQGKQQLAVDIYERGLCVVVPSKCPLLYEKREIAKQRLDRAVDFVSKLPAEILECIFTRVAYRRDFTLANCLQTSKRWRDCLIHQCPTLWKKVSINMEVEPRCNTAGQIIQSIGNQVQCLVIKNLSNDNLKYLTGMAQNNKLPLVRKLKIGCHSPMPSRNVTYYKSLISLLRDNLTMLTMGWNGGRDTLNAILPLCPRLEYLRLGCSIETTFQPLQPPPPNGYQLKRLHLESLIGDKPYNQLLPHCPRLEALAVIDIEPSTLDMIDRYCPIFRHLNVNACNDPPEWGPDDPYENQDPPGLYTLNYNTYSATPIQECSSIFKKSKDTLRMLGLKLYDTEDDQLLQFELSQLTSLSLRVDEGRFPTAESIIRQSPMLESVTLNFRGSRAPDHFFKCFETHAQLSDFNLIEFDANPIDLQEFFDRLARQYQRCALQSVLLMECEEAVVTGQVLSSLANITTLRRIDLINILESVLDEDIETFIEQLHRLPQLEAIRLEELPQITNDMIVNLGTIDGLQTLILCQLDEVTSSGVRALADNASCTLQYASATQCPRVNVKAAKYLLQKVSSNSYPLPDS